MKIRFKASIQLRKLVGLTLLVLGSPLYGQPKTTFTTFDASGAGTTVFLGTYPTAISPGGVVTGYYTVAGTDSFGNPTTIAHGFLRARDATSTTTFDPPGSTGTTPVGITPELVIAGYYTVTDSLGNTVTHGFLRYRNGNFLPFDPSASTTSTQSTGINPEGVVTGYYSDSVGNGNHGFLRAVGGTFTSIDFPDTPGGSSTVVITQSFAINPAKTVTGFYTDSSSGTHGFLRTFSNMYASFDPPGSVYTTPGAINPKGEIIGYYFDILDGYHGPRGFLRTSDGKYAPIDFPDTQPGQMAYQTIPTAINPAGTIVGTYVLHFPASGLYHGFLRTRLGTLTTLDFPDPNQGGTFLAAITPSGEIIGYYYDANYVAHGFLARSHDDETEGLAGSN